MKTILLILCLWQGGTYKQNPQAHEVAKEAGQNEGVVPASRASIHNPCEDTTANDPSTQKHDYPEPSGWWMVIVTALYTIFSGITLYFISQQNRSIQRTERAFLVPTWDNETWINPKHINGDRMNCCFTWRFKNCGKTPGFIREAWGTIILIDDLSQLPKKPKYEAGWPFQGDPLTPDATMGGGPFLAELDDSRPFEEIQEDYRHKSKVLFAYGYTKYDDMFGKSHETRFGVRLAVSPYSMREDQFVIAGPKKYNNYK